MNYSNARQALNQYSRMAVQTDVGEATPHRLIQMLMEGALARIATAKGCMERGDMEQKGAQMSWALSIINGLRASLDKSAGGELAQHLDDLYEYMEWRLFQANKSNDTAGVDEVTSLLREVKEAWDAIPADMHRGAPSAMGAPLAGAR
ncbi:MAG TPA: flagellar export chaperone FliS [Gammaproteobacteria bacterium]|nr:flagellar export chaperone FliS [Gammaproteobacteria bacterium]